MSRMLILVNLLLHRFAIFLKYCKNIGFLYLEALSLFLQRVAMQ